MRNLYLLIVLGSTIPLIGCVTAQSIKPQDVKSYKTPQSLIEAKRLNGKDGNGREYLHEYSVPDALIPYSYMKNLCVSQAGNFVQFSKSRLNKVKGTTIPALKNRNLMDAIGTFKCVKYDSWNVSIEPISSRIGGMSGDPLNFVTLKTAVISDNEAYENMKMYSNYKNAEEAKEKRAIEQYNLEKQRVKNEYERNLIVNAPKPRDIGQTFCKQTELSEFTGTIVLGQPTYRSVNGVVIASLEAFSSDTKNLKINIKGWLNTHNLISSGPDVLYKQTPLESGRVIWDNKQGWYKCAY